jgi:predicted lipoprotein with Yx(FWY)xxD motif
MNKAASAALVVVIGLVAAGCGGDSDTANMDTPGHTLPAFTSGPAMINLGSTERGVALVDARGRALYAFDKDGNNKSTCEGDCLAMWPPATTEGEPQPGKGVRADLLDTIDRGDGTRQITYAGRPLYRFVKDLSPGDAVGQDLQDFGAQWYLLGASGDKVSG